MRWDAGGRIPDTDDLLPAHQTRVLLAVVKVYRARGRVTIREVGTVAGLASTSTVHHHLLELRRLGLVTYR